MTNNKRFSFPIIFLSIGIVFTGVASQAAFAGGMDDQYQECPKERGGFCMELYDPVCAVRDTGVRCIKAPCPAIEKVTFANSCKACSDVKVTGYNIGICRDQTNGK